MAKGAAMRTFPGRSTIKFLSFMAGACVVLATPFPASGQKVRIENGIEVIYNPKDPVPRKGVPSTPVLKEDLVIGIESGDENYMFSALRSIEVDNAGNIYALDDKDLNIRVFDKNGIHLRTFGKRGQGPEELQEPSRLFISPSGEVVVLDSANNKIVFFTKTGKCLKETPLGKYQIFRALVDTKGRIYGDNLIPKENAYGLALSRYDAKMNPEARIAEFENPVSLTKRYMLNDRLTFRMIDRDCLAWAFTKNYVISIVHPEKGTIRKIVKDYARRKITEKDREEDIRSEYGENSPGNISFIFPEYFSPLNYLIADENGFIYVQTNGLDKAGKILYDIFDPNGVCIARLALPPSEYLFVARAGKLYSMIDENEAGIPQIKRYSMEWK
jgi:hypothetical protein